MIATLATASSDEFTARASKAREALLVADEVHNCGAPIYGAVLKSASVSVGLIRDARALRRSRRYTQAFDFWRRAGAGHNIPTAIKKKRLVPFL